MATVCPPSAPLRQWAVFAGREDFWIIVAARSEDETEIRSRRKQPAEKTRSGTSDARRVDTFRPRRRSALCSEGLRGEESIAELCRREGIASSMYYGWSKEFL